MRHSKRGGLIVTVLLAIAVCSSWAQSKKDPSAAQKCSAVLWTPPSDIKHRNLYYGPGGEQEQPKPPLQFEHNVKGGRQPKIRSARSERKKLARETRR